MFVTSIVCRTTFSRPFQLNSVLSRRSSQKSDYIPMIKTHKMNLCELLKKTEREPVHKFLIDSLKKNGHMMLFDCPVKKVSLSNVTRRRVGIKFNDISAMI